MLSYPIDEAEELLSSKLTTAKTSLSNCEEDLDFLREQITVSNQTSRWKSRSSNMPRRPWKLQLQEYITGRSLRSVKTRQKRKRMERSRNKIQTLLTIDGLRTKEKNPNPSFSLLDFFPVMKWEILYIWADYMRNLTQQYFHLWPSINISYLLVEGYTWRFDGLMVAPHIYLSNGISPFGAYSASNC